MGLRTDPLQAVWERYECSRGWDKDEPSRRSRRRQRLFQAPGGLAPRIQKLVRRGLTGDARTSVHEMLRDIALHPGAWSTQLLTVRTVQVLSVLDLTHLRQAVEVLGEYAGETLESHVPGTPLAVEQLLYASAGGESPAEAL